MINCRSHLNGEKSVYVVHCQEDDYHYGSKAKSSCKVKQTGELNFCLHAVGIFIHLHRGRLTKFHPSTSSGSFGRLCACKQKLSKPVRSTLLDEFGNKVYSIYWSLLAIEILFAFFIQQIKPLHKIRYIWWYSN